MSDRVELDQKLAAGEIGFFEYAQAMIEYYAQFAMEFAAKVREGQGLGQRETDRGSDYGSRPPAPMGTDSSGNRGPELPRREDQPPDSLTTPDRPRVAPAAGPSGSADRPSGSGTG